MLPDRRLIESFKWQNKVKLFNLLKRNEVSNVVLISGDVHMAQLYENKCRSLTGQRNLIEVTSSGLSHSQKDFFPWAVKNMILHTPKFYAIDVPYIDLNFGEMKITQTGIDLMLKDYNGAVVQSKNLTYEEMKFEKSLLTYDKYCIAKSSKQ
jgi:hypothetical protein